MMLLQGPEPPVPPIGPQFDPNLIFMQDGGPSVVVLIVIAGLTALTIILWPIMRAFARRLEGKGNLDSAFRAEVEQLDARLAEVDALRQEVAELHERVDFAERVLLKSHERNELGKGQSAG
jgi:Tfp pilus assembly protein PilO